MTQPYLAVSQKISKNIRNGHTYSKLSTQFNLAKDHLAANGAVQRVMATKIFPQNNTFFFYRTVHCNEISSSIVPARADMFSHFTLETGKRGRDISIYKHSADFTINASRSHSMKISTSLPTVTCFIILIISKRPTTPLLSPS